VVDRLQRALSEPRDASALAVFRMLFGLLMVGSVARYFLYGWIDRFYVRPRMHFTYWGLDWVQPLPEPGMTILLVGLGVCAAMIAVGLAYRFAAAAFFVGFTYLHLLDVSNYLNHYYLVSLIALLLILLPLHGKWSLDARLRPSVRRETLPAWMTYLLRFQVGVVYVFAALAKVGPDWLLHGQPLGIWLHSRTDTPVIGPWLDEPMVALAMSWAGFLYDATIVFWLSWRRTRPFAFVVVCAFHFMTHVFFSIGIFPIAMTIAVTVFFSEDWPRRLLARGRALHSAVIRRKGREGSEGARTGGAGDPLGEPSRAVASPLPRWGVAVLAAWAMLHVLLPLRTHLYGGDPNWHEQGMRWAWRVMVREKNGDVRYRVRVNGESRERIFVPNDYLTREQEIEFAGQPDLILQLAHHIRDELEADGYRDVEVRADAWASLNGRRSARLIDPEVDLARVHDGVAPAAWILPVPDGPPIRLRSHRAARVAGR